MDGPIIEGWLPNYYPWNYILNFSGVGCSAQINVFSKMSNPTIIATRVRRLLEGTSSLTTEDVRFGCWFATDPHPDYAVLVREATDEDLEEL